MHPFDRPHALRRDALRAAMADLGADAAHHYMLVRGGDRIVRFHGVGGVDTTPETDERWRAAEGLAIVHTEADPDHIAPMNVLGTPPEDMYATPVWRYAFAEVGWNRAWFTNVTRGAEMRGHACVLRASPAPWDTTPTARERAAARLCPAFREAWDLELALAPPEGAAIVRDDGSLAADERVSDWIAAHDAADWLLARARTVPGPDAGLLGRSDRAWAPGAFVYRRAVPGGGTLLSFERVQATEVPPVLLLLTDHQRRIASLAAAGATAAEIARELGRSPETVREHLTRIYERLGVSSRAELTSVCRKILL